MKITKTCNTCLMDESADGIQFDAVGNCNYCKDMKSRLYAIQPKSEVAMQDRLSEFINRVKADGRNKPYDCIVGLSGGADSAYALYLACTNGLRPLAVHMDNGWNSELAVNNIECLVKKFKVDLYTDVINWKEYRQLQQAFFDADVIDVELLYDNAMLAVNYNLAQKYGIKYILSGSNSSTEGMRVPSNYNWNKFDRKNIHAIASAAGAKVKSLPTIGVIGYIWKRVALGIQWVHFLDYIEYDKNKCIDELVKECGYRPYPYKHYESIFTRFYQGHILPNKFLVDKRRLHLSSLICSGQISRDVAIGILTESPYHDSSDLESDIEYFLKKMKWSKRELETYLTRPGRPHSNFPSEAHLYNYFRAIYNKITNLRGQHSGG